MKDSIISVFEQAFIMHIDINFEVTPRSSSGDTILIQHLDINGMRLVGHWDIESQRFNIWHERVEKLAYSNKRHTTPTLYQIYDTDQATAFADWFLAGMRFSPRYQSHESFDWPFIKTSN